MPTDVRHPEHVELWKIIDNPASPQEDVDLAKEIIAERDDRPSQGEIPSLESFEKRHPDDVKLWAVVDDSEAKEIERMKALECIVRRRKRRIST